MKIDWIRMRIPATKFLRPTAKKIPATIDRSTRKTPSVKTTGLARMRSPTTNGE